MENSTRERGDSISLRREPINGDLALSCKMADEKAARDKYSSKVRKRYWAAFNKWVEKENIAEAPKPIPNLWAEIDRR